MTINMNDGIISIAQVSELIKAAESIGVERVERTDGTDEVYRWMNDLLIRLRYGFLKKKEKGVVRRYLALYGGYTESHIDHLIARYRLDGRIVRKERTQPEFERVYTSVDIGLLADVAEGYQHQNGRALKEVCREMYAVYNDDRFERLANLSVSRLYDLKKTEVFKTKALHYTKTRAAQVPIGERKKPYPEGKPGFLRVDSVHQGDRDKEKGVYHINLVDEVTQDEIVVCVEGISEEFLHPALEDALAQFPFVILNFHSDNGSEYINKVVARLLQKLLIKQTKSRSRRTNDNALVEGKNGAVVRKHMGFMHIPKKHAGVINDFYRNFFNPFVNFHRFCAFPDEKIDASGKITKVYRTYLTPIGKLLSLEDVEQYLKHGITKESLLAQAHRQSHLAAAQEMQKAKAQLFKLISAPAML
jgi:hypothetical protein